MSMDQAKQDLFKLLTILVCQQGEGIERMYSADRLLSVPGNTRQDLAIAQKNVIEINHQILATIETMKAANESAI